MLPLLFLLLLLMVKTSSSCNVDPPNQCTWFMSNLTFETRVKALMNEMNVSEKLNVLNQESVPRLHIPNDGFNEALHGVAWAGRATVFPCPMGMASTWNTDLIHEMGIVVSYEALAKHKNGTNALSFYAPNINIVRDVRWGRAQETYGEDPTLTGLMASAYINGMQFPRGKNDSLAVRNVAKHFAAYNLESNFAVGGTDGQFRLSYDANVSTEDLENTFLPAFREIVSDVSGVMCAYVVFECEAREFLLIVSLILIGMHARNTRSNTGTTR